MSFKAEMTVTGIKEPYRILSCSYNLHRETDMFGKPQTRTQGGTINISVETTTDTSLSDWMFSHFDHKDGEIKFFKTEAESTAKTLEFFNASLVDYSESFSAGGGMPMMANMVISAERIKIGQGEHDNEWVKG